MTANMIELRTHYDYSGSVPSPRTCWVSWAALIPLSTSALMKWASDCPHFTNEQGKQMVHRRIKVAEVNISGG